MRRRFLLRCLAALSAAGAASALWPVFRYLAPRPGAGAGEKVAIPETEVPEGGARFFEFAGTAAVLVRPRGGELVALSAVCTHLGCLVQWQKDAQEFLCPCHAGRFTAGGAVVSGPPPRPLPRLPFAVSGGTITVG